MARQAVVLFELLRHDEPPPDHNAGSCDEREREAERQPEGLRLVRNRIDRVDDRERNAAQRRTAEQREREVLGAAIRWSGLHDPFLPREPRTASQPPEQQDKQRDEPAPHVLSRLPITTQVATIAAIPMNQVTSPSGTGPICPIAQPPRSSGCFA